MPTRMRQETSDSETVHCVVLGNFILSSTVRLDDVTKPADFPRELDVDSVLKQPSESWDRFDRSMRWFSILPHRHNQKSHRKMGVT